MQPLLKFTPFQSSVDVAFWQSLVSKKLDILKLSSEPQTIHGYYTSGQIASSEGTLVNIPGPFILPPDGLEIQDSPNHIKGTLVNTNTIEEFRSVNKNQLFQQVTENIEQAVKDKRVLDDPNVLNSFLLLTFADLKKYKFYYWFAFPAFIPSSPWLIKHQEAVSLSLEDSHLLYFFVKKDEAGQWQTAPLNEFETYHSDKECTIGCLDPSTSQDAFGWPLRNLLYFVNKVWGWNQARVLCYRPKQTSYLLHVELPEQSGYLKPAKAVGWEKNVQGALGPRMVDLGPLMDPVRLADTSVDLNLKLMRWRLLPDLDLEKIKQTKCLLLGAGTLGCYVARCLLGWGVRHITFVDNGKVSFSNPVRQPLYQFEDALQGGSPKAETAAKQLKRIQPTVVSQGHDLSIPMPGHSFSSDQALEQDMNQLTELIKQHDVVYLLTDSRESRWFPTMLGAYFNKLVINSALGFDTFLVMRHGSTSSNLGCYFCNDIVAPTDSLTDRTLDQQCTVTRPGLAAIAGALSVELMVSIIQHPEGINAKADSNQQDLLGLLPHQIRGFLGQFNNMLIVGQAYDKCTACSQKILKAYELDPIGFLKQVLKEPDYLEKITGLAELKRESEALLLDDWAEEVDDDF